MTRQNIKRFTIWSVLPKVAFAVLALVIGMKWAAFIVTFVAMVAMVRMYRRCRREDFHEPLQEKYARLREDSKVYVYVRQESA
jgi:hypothetical protein